jgi:hypothetical protein
LKRGEAVTVLGQIKGVRNTTNFDNSPDVHVMPSQYSFSSSRFRPNAVLVTILSLPTSIDFDSFRFSQTGLCPQCCADRSEYRVCPHA